MQTLLQHQEAPRHQHDCERCAYLGRFERFDLYACNRGEDLLARFGDEGPQYLSTLVACVERDSKPEWAVEALKRYRALPSTLPPVVGRKLVHVRAQYAQAQARAKKRYHQACDEARKRLPFYTDRDIWDYPDAEFSAALALDEKRDRRNKDRFDKQIKRLVARAHMRLV